MCKVSELLGKPLIDTFDAKIVGTVSNIYFDQELTEARFLRVTDEEMNESFVPFSDVKNLHGEAVTVDHFFAVTPPPCAKNPINTPAYDKNGNFLGKIRDIILQENLLQRIVCEKNSYDRNALYSYSNSLLILKTN